MNKTLLLMVCAWVLGWTAQAAALSWDPNKEPDVAGYKVYERTTSASYGTGIDVGKVTTYQPPTLTPGLHYWTVTAYDTAKNESVKSDEVSLMVFPLSDPAIEVATKTLAAIKYEVCKLTTASTMRTALRRAVGGCS